MLYNKSTIVELLLFLEKGVVNGTVVVLFYPLHNGREQTRTYIRKQPDILFSSTVVPKIHNLFQFEQKINILETLSSSRKHITCVYSKKKSIYSHLVEM